MHNLKKPAVRITELDLKTAEKISNKSFFPDNINLLDRIIFENLRSLTTKIFLLEWEGVEIPFGAKIEDKEIFYIQYGRVIDTMGNPMGTYQRLAEFGEMNRNRHQMLIYTL